jgi:hypothetical protein
MELGSIRHPAISAVRSSASERSVGGPCIGASLTSVVSGGIDARHGTESSALVVDDELRVDVTSWPVADLADRATDLAQIVNRHL